MDELNANPDTGASSEASGDDPVSQFAALIEGKAKQADTPAQPKGDGAETPTDNPEAAQDDAPADTEKPAERTYKVKVGGEEIEVPEKELLSGYQRDRDYRVKTEQLSEQRKAFEAERAAVSQDRAHLMQAAQHFLANLPQIGPPDDAMLDSDPVAYLKQMRAYQHTAQQRAMAAQAIQQVQAKEAQDRQQFTAAQQQQLTEQLQREASRLPDLIPDWKDTKTREAESKSIRSWLEKSGASVEAIDSIRDAGILWAVREGMLRQKERDAVDAANKRVHALPQRVQRSGVAETVRATDGRTSAMQALRKSGSTDAATAVFEKLI